MTKTHAKDKVSFTAECVAWLRAVGARESDKTLRNPDHLAHDLLHPQIRALSHVPGGWRMARRIWEIYAPGYYEYEIARTKYIDGVLLGEVAAGIDQLVLIGSGYDSRVYRFEDRLAGLRVFELDRSAMLERKRRRVAKRGYRDVGAAQVALDLNLETPLSAVKRHGYDAGARTLFVCSGVTMYLDPEAVDRLLAFVAEEAGEGSSICFDHLFAGALAEPTSYYGARWMVRGVKRIGEPYRFAIDPPDLPALLEPHGLSVLSDAGPAELERAYVRRSDGSLRGRVCGYLALAHAGRQPLPPAA